MLPTKFTRACQIAHTHRVLRHTKASELHMALGPEYFLYLIYNNNTLSGFQIFVVGTKQDMQAQTVRFE